MRIMRIKGFRRERYEIQCVALNNDSTIEQVLA